MPRDLATIHLADAPEIKQHIAALEGENARLQEAITAALVALAHLADKGGDAAIIGQISDALAASLGDDPLAAPETADAYDPQDGPPTAPLWDGY